MAFVTTLHLQASAAAALSCKPMLPVTRGGHGHTLLTYSHLTRGNTTLCESCQIPITLHHALLSCPVHDDLHQILFPDTTSLCELLEDDEIAITSVFLYLKKTNAFIRQLSQNVLRLHLNFFQPFLLHSSHCL